MSCHDLSRFDPVQPSPFEGRHSEAPPRRAWGRLLAILLVMVAVGSHAPVYAQGYSEIEPNNPCGNAQDLRSAAFPVQVTGYKTQPFGDAVDFYQFSAAPGTQLQAALSGDSSQPNPLTAFGVGVYTSDCPEYPNYIAFTNYSTARVDFTVPADGTFIIGVTACCDISFTGSGTIEGAYVLAVGPPPAPTVITGAVTDAQTGLGLPGNQSPFAWVTLEQCFDYGYWGFCYSLQSQPTDSQGYFRFEGEFDGNFRVSVNADPYFYEQPVLRPTGPSDYASILIPRGTHYDFGVIPLVPIVPVQSISGQVIDRVTGRPLSGAGEPYARVQLFRQSQTGLDFVAEIATDHDGTYVFSSAVVGRPLIQGDYRVVGYANQYQTSENFVDVLGVQPREVRVAPVLRLLSNPVRITNVMPCRSVPAQGGTCEFSYNVTVGGAARMAGTAWSLVNATGTGGFTDGTNFVACEQPLTLVAGPSATSQEVRCRFSVPARVPAYASICTDARFGEDSRANPHWTVQAEIDPLFCMMKLPGQGTFKVLPQRAAVELSRREAGRRQAD